MDTQIIVQLLVLVGSLFTGGGIFVKIISDKMDSQRKATEKQAKATEAQTVQNALVGRLRISMEGLQRRHAKEHNIFLEYLGGAYVRGNDVGVVDKRLKQLQQNRDDIEDRIDELQKAINAVYAHKITESDVDRIIGRVENSYGGTK